MYDHERLNEFFGVKHRLIHCLPHRPSEQRVRPVDGRLEALPELQQHLTVGLSDVTAQCQQLRRCRLQGQLLTQLTNVFLEECGTKPSRQQTYLSRYLGSHVRIAIPIT